MKLVTLPWPHCYTPIQTRDYVFVSKAQCMRKVPDNKCNNFKP